MKSIEPYLHERVALYLSQHEYGVHDLLLGAWGDNVREASAAQLAESLVEGILERAAVQR